MQPTISILRAEDWWMTGEWKFDLKLQEKATGLKKTETATVVVPRFNFPPIPTGIEIDDIFGAKVSCLEQDRRSWHEWEAC